VRSAQKIQPDYELLDEMKIQEKDHLIAESKKREMMNDRRWAEEQAKWSNAPITTEHVGNQHQPSDSKLSFDPTKWAQLNERNYDQEFQEQIQKKLGYFASEAGSLT
jgi:hypothetical protein